MSQKGAENPSYPASSFVKLQLMDQVCRVLVSWDVLQEEGGGGGIIFPQPRGGSGREAEADQWRQVELGMGWPQG